MTAKSASSAAWVAREEEFAVGVEPGSRSERREAQAQSRQSEQKCQERRRLLLRSGQMRSFLPSIRTQGCACAGNEPESGADVPLSYNGDWAKAEFFK